MMNYEEFKAEYDKLTLTMLKLKLRQLGVGHYAEKLADLVEEYPEFEQAYDREAVNEWNKLNKKSV